MPRSIALAYGIAGTAVAAAVLVITATTTGLLDASADEPETVAVAGVQDAALAAPGPEVDPALTAGQAEQVQYVYVDAPASSRDHDDDDEDEEHDDDHDDDDDDDDRRRGHDDDDDDDDHDDD